ncbi:type VI secretion protein [Actinacidiphila sp. DG2A-62]|uniref:type IV secretory system conjugative DNA transfer family protein n=1 Tax=Actinacidiphila sp. DG2A-62 TaxID=3108821 RepID=UPI002DB717E7|nr:type VI secretion protein [Actinacidiphila sp. DG2A-62]MEC3995969.1 type VI secretion protein [Actinacidiphila sp. DG2A-62]
MAGRKKQQQGGLPDGLVVSVIALLLGVTLLVWTATGISGLLAHGSWPSGLHFTRTPQAMRSLIAEPHDMPAAWPQTDPADLSDSGLFWGVFIAQFMVLFVLAVWFFNALNRWRTRGLRRHAPPAPAPEQEQPAPLPRQRRARGPAVAKDDESLDAWFRTVPRATPPAATAPAATGAAGVPGAPGGGYAQDPPTAHLPAAALAGGAGPGADPAPASTGAAPGFLTAASSASAALADGEVSRTYALFADPRGDKGKQIVQPAVLAAAGPVVVTTADPETYHQTAGNRAKLGPVHVFDPTHLLDVPGRLRWAPHSGCERPATARTRAAALLAPLRTERADEAIVHDTAATLLRCWLHAAAIGGLPFRQIQRWAAGGAAAGEAVRILRTDVDAASGWSGELESVLHAHPERRDAAHAVIRRITEPLGSVHIRDACSPGRTGGLDLESFTAERGTLYVVGQRVEEPRTHPGAMPLLTALVSSVVEHGRGMAAGSSSGRLDPPMTFVLDDIAALAPLPELPGLLAEGHAAGLPALAVLRSPEQALARWGAPVWQHADLRLALGDEHPAVPDAVRLR